MSETSYHDTAEGTDGEVGRSGDRADSTNEPGENSPADDGADTSEAETGPGDSASSGNGDDGPAGAQDLEARNTPGNEDAARDNGAREPGEGGPAEGGGDGGAAQDAQARPVDAAQPGGETSGNAENTGETGRTGEDAPQEAGDSGPAEREDLDTASATDVDQAQSGSGEASGPDGSENPAAEETSAGAENPEGSDDAGSSTQALESQDPEGGQHAAEDGDLQASDNESEDFERTGNPEADENRERHGSPGEADLNEPGERGPADGDLGPGDDPGDRPILASGSGSRDTASPDDRHSSEAAEPVSDEHDTEPSENRPAQDDKAPAASAVTELWEPPSEIQHTPVAKLGANSADTSDPVTERKPWEAQSKGSDLPQSMKEDLKGLGEDLNKIVNPVDWENADINSRLKMLDNAHNRIREEYELPQHDVSYPADIDSDIYGLYDLATGDIMVNSRVLKMADPSEAIKTLAHENFHDYQQQVMDRHLADPYAQSRVDDWIKGAVDYDPDDFTAYMQNPLEADAYAVEEEVYNGYRGG